MKVIVFTDAHANLPALRAFAAAARREGYDAAFHTGDAVGIGPWPGETVDMLGEMPRLHLLTGNHDAWLCGGLPEGSARWLADHYAWMRKRVMRRHINAAAAWPYLTEHDFEGVRAAFVHYALGDSGRQVKLDIAEKITADLDGLIGRHSSLMVFHGHRHKASDIKGKVRYINPGSLGCWHKPAARYAIVRFHKGKASIQHRAVPYDRSELLAGFAACGMPDAEKILGSYFAS
ncbi:MAG: metallophosphoesterase family protein [Elusimicrobiales bacterium]|jgi:predicted phosphodiesterase|nr:metallophosphoesterase family protein [Elusimicrobiales bacterium]